MTIGKFAVRIFGPALFAALLQSITVLADVYRWVDENGKVHYSDQPPSEQSAESLELKINSYESVTYTDSSADVGKKVVMYSASWCGVCKKARRYFEENNIAYTEYDIEKDAKGKADFNRLKARGVPVILVGRKRMNGFSVDGFNDLYR